MTRVGYKLIYQFIVREIIFYCLRKILPVVERPFKNDSTHDKLLGFVFDEYIYWIQFGLFQKYII